MEPQAAFPFEKVLRKPGPITRLMSRRAAAGRAQLLANRPYWAGPLLSASRCRPLAVGPSLTVWHFFLGAQGERQIL